MIRNSSSNPLFDFSGCMTSHLLKYPLPRQETVTHYHIFRHPLFEWLLLKIHIYIIKYYLCFKVNSFGIITHVFFALCLSVEQISKIVFSTILDSTNVNWIFSLFWINVGKYQKLFAECTWHHKFEIQPRLVCGINRYAKNQLFVSSKLIHVTSATECQRQ